MNIKQLEKANIAYYAGNPIMTDAEFDTTIAELRKNDPGHPFLKQIGAPVPGKLKVKHILPMGSLDNANNEEEFRAWLSKNNFRKIHLSHKLDGSSLEFIYQSGSFVQAITRGDGEIGEDVTRNILKSGNVPLLIDPEIISVRCECLIYKDDWIKYFEGDANPRNSAAGTLRRHDGHNAKYLRFYAFDALPIIVGNTSPDFMYENDLMDMLSYWFLVPDYMLSKHTEHFIEWCQEVENNRDTFPYEIDGVVAKIDDRAISQEMGSRDGRPRGQIAIKFKPRGGETVLNNVVWQVGHTGSLTPVGEVSPVGVGGVIIKRVTLCNMDEIKRLGIAIGDTVEIIRAGDVIPKLSKLICKGFPRRPIYWPQKCPVCGYETKLEGAKLFCKNEQCEGTSIGRIMTWIKKRNILNLGIGIIKAAKIESIYHLYNMTLDEWMNIQTRNGILGPKRAKRVMEALKNSRLVSLPEFLGSIGIKGVGRSLCRYLCKGLGLKTLDDVLMIHPEQIEKLEGFGPTRAYEFCGWLLEHKEEVMKLASVMNFEGKLDMDKNKIFSGEIICFTGKSPKSRKEMSDLAEAAGASVNSSVNKNTTILVIADPNSQSSKAVRAREMGINLMSPEEFMELIY